MGRLGNVFVLWLLGSPFHRMLSGKVGVVAYECRRSGDQMRLPVQYARLGEQVIVVPGHAGSKTWWRNFERPHDATLLLAGMSVEAVGVVVRDAVQLAPLVDAYQQRFPKALDVGLLVVFTPIGA
jgi:hypothetical protein